MTEQEQRDEALAEFLAKGGKIQQVAPGVSGRAEGYTGSAWGAPRKAGRPAADAIVPIIEPTDELDD
jgi:hypothetical protein